MRRTLGSLAVALLPSPVYGALAPNPYVSGADLITASSGITSNSGWTTRIRSESPGALYGRGGAYFDADDESSTLTNLVVSIPETYGDGTVGGVSRSEARFWAGWSLQQGSYSYRFESEVWGGFELALDHTSEIEISYGAWIEEFGRTFDFSNALVFFSVKVDASNRSDDVDVLHDLIQEGPVEGSFSATLPAGSHRLFMNFYREAETGVLGPREADYATFESWFSFRVTPVPSPGPAAVLGIGIAAVGTRRR